MPEPPADRPAPAPAPPKRAATFTTTTNSSAHSPDPTSNLRSRGPRRQTSAQSLSSSHSRSPAPPAPDRRASTFSLSSIDEIGQTLAEDLINPSFTRSRNRREDGVGGDGGEEEVTNWHSTPLLFALLPAVGGVLFKEGAAVVTDLLILGLAGIFLNWSVRLPWDWYYAAQVVVREARRGDSEEDGDGDEDVIVEEDEGEGEGEKGEADETAKEQDTAANDRMAAITERREEALAGLRTQESFALISTFLFPALAAYLLHVLRGQLSPSSTGLVSDYNLSIFLLVAEIRPCRQLIRLVKRRTLHLQRSATPADAADPGGAEPSTIRTLTTRLNELEQQLQEQASTSLNGHAKHTTIQKSHFDELSAEMKKRYESRIDALERAVRRYEKRTTTLAMVTEQRLKAIDTRLSDTLSLAAVAAQESHRRSAFGRMIDGLLAMVMLPLRMAGMVVMAPVKVLEEAYARLKAFLFGSKPRSKARKRVVEPGRDDKVREKAFVRSRSDGPVR